MHLTHHMSLPEHLLSQVHQLGHTVLAISDKLVKLESDKGDTLGTVENQSSRQSLLSQLSQRSNQDLVLTSLSARIHRDCREERY